MIKNNTSRSAKSVLYGHVLYKYIVLKRALLNKLCADTCYLTEKKFGLTVHNSSCHAQALHTSEPWIFFTLNNFVHLFLRHRRSNLIKLNGKCIAYVTCYRSQQGFQMGTTRKNTYEVSVEHILLLCRLQFLCSITKCFLL